MPMDASPYSSSSSDSSQFSSSNSSPAKGSSTTVVLSIECLKGSSKGDEWTGDMLQTGDIVEEIRIGNMIIKSPFKNGKSGVQKILHSSFKNKETSIRVRVRRGSDELAELQACIVPGDQFLGRRQYVLRAIDDPNYAVGFFDRTESECLNLQASRTIRMVSALERTPLQGRCVSYPWERRMHEMLSIPNSSSFYSILFLPKASDKAGSRYNDLETPSQGPTRISGDTASSTVNTGSLSDLSNLANTSLYGFEDYHGVDIGVVRAVRLWFSPLAGEIPIEIKIKDTDTKLGFAISRTEEGFIYISSVIKGDDDTPSTRSGISHLHEQATKTSRLLVVSRISNQKVLPWMVSTTGAIRCFDTVSLSQKLSLHRHTRARAMSTYLHSPPSGTGLEPNVHENRVMPLEMDGDSVESGVSDDGPEIRRERDTAGEFSFRFRVVVTLVVVELNMVLLAVALLSFCVQMVVHF
ncbi:hypothetical protein DH2020_027849 [Rehmannia glutinosa]|uniref:Uncharacterized protein n=1 Tax=Rehmannia glutinosa TaxID=99300 RepID=A0ABR0VVR2_REHGL